MHACGIVMIDDALITKNHRPTINLGLIVYRSMLRNKNTYYYYILYNIKYQYIMH